MSRPTTEERFWSKVDKTNSCWFWASSMYPDGYGQFWLKPRKVRAHRFAYELLVGPIPEGMVLDHLCRRRDCVNPEHLEPVTNRQNLMRGIGISSRNARAIKCIHGHPFSPENTHVAKDGKRVCRTCNRENRRRSRLKYAARQQARP